MKHIYSTYAATCPEADSSAPSHLFHLLDIFREAFGGHCVLDNVFRLPRCVNPQQSSQQNAANADDSDVSQSMKTPIKSLNANVEAESCCAFPPQRLTSPVAVVHQWSTSPASTRRRILYGNRERAPNIKNISVH